MTHPRVLFSSADACRDNNEKAAEKFRAPVNFGAKALAFACMRSVDAQKTAMKTSNAHDTPSAIM
jgi:hypothetical protein